MLRGFSNMHVEPCIVGKTNGSEGQTDSHDE